MRHSLCHLHLKSMVHSVGIKKGTRNASHVGVEGKAWLGIGVSAGRQVARHARNAAPIRTAGPHIARRRKARRQRNVAVVGLQEVGYRPGADRCYENPRAWSKLLLNA